MLVLKPTPHTAAEGRGSCTVSAENVWLESLSPPLSSEGQLEMLLRDAASSEQETRRRWNEVNGSKAPPLLRGEV